MPALRLLAATLVSLSAVWVSGCVADASEGSEQAPDEAHSSHHQKPIFYELDPGMKYTVKSGSTTLGEIVVIQDINGAITDYYTVFSALPAGATSLSMDAATQSSPPSSYTFAISPPSFGSTSAPSSSSTLFVDGSDHIGLVWGLTFNRTLNKWTGSAAWYHNTSNLISVTPGSYTLNGSTSDSALTYVANDTAP